MDRAKAAAIVGIWLGVGLCGLGGGFVAAIVALFAMFATFMVVDGGDD